MSFKIPSSIPQDLLLIHEMISTGEHRDQQKSTQTSISDDSSSSESDDSDTDSMSEDELKVDESLKLVPENESETMDTLDDAEPLPSEDSDSSSSDESSEAEEDSRPMKVKDAKGDSEDEDEDTSGIPVSDSAVRSKNEIAEPANVPEIQEVHPDERIEKVGEIMSVIDSVVVVKGISSETSKASERALDSESLLVFEDRKVLGYVHETFGPTQQPFYQIKFPSAASINTELVMAGKPVFHLPDRSNFVFPSQLRLFKGSDASNIHDEEVNEDELEFSDDEAEQAFRRQRKRNGRDRSSSVASSRFSTPVPSLLREQDFMDDNYESSPYDEYSPYNMGSEAGPSRPVPLPYDDPYQDAPRPASPTSSVMSDVQSSYGDRSNGYGDGRGRGRGRGALRGRGRGRDGGSGYRERERGNRRGRGGGGRDVRPSHHEQRSRDFVRHSSNPPLPRPLSPTSLAIARATGQFSDGSSFHEPHPSSPSPSMEPQSASWNTHGSFVQYAAASMGNHSQPQAQDYSQAGGFVQPHINPRFASMFGLDMNFMQQQQQLQQYSPFQPTMFYNGAGTSGGWDGWNAGTTGAGEPTGMSENSGSKNESKNATDASTIRQSET